MDKKIARCLYNLGHVARQQTKPLHLARFFKSTTKFSLQLDKAAYDVAMQPIRRHGSKQLVTSNVEIVVENSI